MDMDKQTPAPLKFESGPSLGSRLSSGAPPPSSPLEAPEALSASALSPPELRRAELLKGYQMMVFIRFLELELVDYYLKNKVMSFVHFYVGQEAVAAGVCNSLNSEDKVFGNHRSHGHYLAKGGNPESMVAELLGRRGGCCRGKGGSMHMIDRGVNFLGSTPILGSVAPIATGSALASKLRGDGQVTACFFGDGASEEGVVHESINFAALFKLPLIFVLENNLYSVMTKLKDRRSAAFSSEKIVTGFGATYLKADGNDYLDVRNKAMQAHALALEGRPTVLECTVYRHMAHSAPLCDDKLNYREIDFPEERAKQDPICKLRALLSSSDAAAKELQEIDHATIAFCKEIIHRASEQPYPDPAELMTDVYV
jgi:acetoin:2,6-dichlorophenolindophenol oxidoreductase subunit alpha